MLAQLSRQLFEDLSEALSNHSGALPHKELRALLESALQRLNLVTREEFDAQASVLLRTREKLEALERELEVLQERIENDAHHKCKVND